MILAGIGLGVAASALHFKKGGSGKLDISKIIPKSDTKEADSKTKEKSWPPSMTVSTIQTAAVPPNLDKY